MRKKRCQSGDRVLGAGDRRLRVEFAAWLRVGWLFAWRLDAARLVVCAPSFRAL